MANHQNLLSTLSDLVITETTPHPSVDHTITEQLGSTVQTPTRTARNSKTSLHNWWGLDYCNALLTSLQSSAIFNQPKRTPYHIPLSLSRLATSSFPYQIQSLLLALRNAAEQQYHPTSVHFHSIFHHHLQSVPGGFITSTKSPSTTFIHYLQCSLKKQLKTHLQTLHVKHNYS